ncbi:MAG: threonylcarbamoyl-AMP synthase [Flavobacteriales bacterium]|jgi:L-threonylcarbamoyladenylate synthase|uniref:L-threonylcarbamoyladenylate synthase n=1 Tax=Blattabacterium sp. (Mastotermes darwiniensis) TaxID=39768 RepID=UPI000231DDC7|nr:L-threonylcarbamoyladenylate synthase [Blattabacterium sp. (Mastotermes darwiniensis)]AER40507.1 Sua5/YciO/YrdC/YwlC family protein [Blattabacterium sp. (Mastotermes darwiniensis) str. MADAR]MDR1804978.1 threonylcarbamoyl-AMP synthase [Flavobacteriales bacterium]
MSFHKEIEISVKILKKGKVLLYPTDTVWGLGCDAFNLNAIEKIYKIKNRDISKSMIVLVEKIDRLYELIERIPNLVKRIIQDNHIKRKKPITIVYDNPSKKIYNLLIRDNTLAIRLTNDLFCNSLIKELDRPIVSTSANLSGFQNPKYFSDIHPSILSKIDYAVNFRRKEKSRYNHSSIIKIISNKVKILRV